MIVCGVPDDGVLFDGVDTPDRVSAEIFDDDFESCLILTPDDIKVECKTLAGLTARNRQIRLRPACKRNLKAFVEWTKGKLLVGANPEMEVFLVADAMEYIRRQKAHKQYINARKLWAMLQNRRN